MPRPKTERKVGPADACSCHRLAPARRTGVRIDRDVPMKTRDGVTLRADVYRPETAGRFPVLLSRLPYDKSGRRRPGDIDVFVEHGYVVIFQDTRGRFASEGDEYYPLIWEARDATWTTSGATRCMADLSMGPSMSSGIRHASQASGRWSMRTITTPSGPTESTVTSNPSASNPGRN
jgi:hypothetical protein